MRPVPTALLLHTTREGSHHDWLLGDPDQAGLATDRLWTARLDPPSREWAAVGQFELTPLPPHRPRYLRYEGPISQERGEVRRVDAGYALALLWRTDRAVLAVRMVDFVGRVALHRVNDARWTASVIDVVKDEDAAG